MTRTTRAQRTADPVAIKREQERLTKACAVSQVSTINSLNFRLLNANRGTSQVDDWLEAIAEQEVERLEAFLPLDHKKIKNQEKKKARGKKRM